MDNELLISNIKNLCKSNNIPISQLEKNLGFGAGLISRWAKADPSFGKIIDIADFFYVSLDSLAGRKMHKQESFVPLLLKLTQNKKVIWKNGKEITYPASVDNFELFDDDDVECEIILTELSGGIFYLIAQYEYQYGRMESLDLQLYIQPDYDSQPVMQDIEFDDIYDLWLAARIDIFGVPDEYKANKFITDFIKNFNKPSE